MTVIIENHDHSTTNGTTAALTNGGLVAQSNLYKQVMKKPKAHERTIVGVECFQNGRTRQLTLATLAHDSIKLWSITAFEDDFELFPLQTVSCWNCAIQSYTGSPDGKQFSLVSTDCSLHHITLAEDGGEEPRHELVEKGLMEIWFVRAISAEQQQFLTVNFETGQLEILDRAGTVVNSAKFEKARQVSALAYCDRFIALGTSQGAIFIANSDTLGTLYSTEGHAMKVRCLQFTNAVNAVAEEEPRLLSGSDDKTIKLFSLTDSKASLLRIFCGHKGIVTALSVCRASAGERFASSGADNCLIVWAMDSGEKLHVFANCTATLNDVPRSLTFTPNGRYLLAGTDESALFAYRVPQPENFVEEEIPMEETGEEEQFQQQEEEEMMDMGGNEENEYVPEGEDAVGAAGHGFPEYGQVSPTDEQYRPQSADEEHEQQQQEDAEAAATFQQDISSHEGSPVAQNEVGEGTPQSEGGLQTPAEENDQQKQAERQGEEGEDGLDDLERQELEMQLGID